MKKINIFLSLALCMIVLFSCAVQAGADIARMWPIGDIDRDYDLTILDTTKIQRFLAGFGEMTELDRALGDADGSGEVTILDATCIQRYLANLSCPYTYGELYDYYIGDTSFHSTAEIYAPGGDGTREIGYVGVPITFYTRLKWGNPPQSYRFSINGETVQESNADGERTFSVTHTFDAEGTYEVQLLVTCKYGVTKTFSHRVDVRSLPEDGRPVVMGAAFFDQTWMSSGNGDLTVTAAGGTAPYQYCFTAYYAEAPIFDLPADGGSSLGESAPEVPGAVNVLVGKMVTTGYIDKDTVNPPQLMARYDCDYNENLYIRITVRDADGRESASVTVVCYQYTVDV